MNNQSPTINIDGLAVGKPTSLQQYPKHDLLDGADAATRKMYPLKTGCIDYFRDALLRVSRVSYEGNKQHNGEDHPLQWTRGLSADHTDCIARHLATADDEEHFASMAWRALAALQMFLEQKYEIKPPPSCK